METEIPRHTRRGYEEEDIKWFSPDQVLRLKVAQEEINWLLDRGYKISSIIDLVGGHYQLSSRQRTALMRATSVTEDYRRRLSKQLSLKKAKEGCIYIDGFNIIITLEVALSKGTLILGSDGAVRDLAGLRGTYRLIDKTEMALELLGKAFNDCGVPQIKFYFDAPVSNSGRLRSKILEHAVQWGIETEVDLVPNADPILSQMERIVTSDSIILDKCISWFNLSKNLIENYMDDVKIIDLSRG